MEQNTVYALLDVTIEDKKKFLEYSEGHRHSMQQYGGKLLFRSNDSEVVEGNWSPELLVVQEWPSAEVFYARYDSRDYEPWKKMRKYAVDINMVLAERMPGRED